MISPRTNFYFANNFKKYEIMDGKFRKFLDKNPVAKQVSLKNWEVVLKHDHCEQILFVE
jgi:hypothetical protein